MECYNKIRITNNAKLLINYPEGIEVSCGKCINCLANKARDKAIRVLHESETKTETGEKKYKINFLTFTYDDNDENIKLIQNEKGNLSLRKDLVRKIRNKIYSRFYRRDRELAKSYKYMIAGEYGENGTERPHYHMIILTSKKTSKIIHEFIKEFRGGRYDIKNDTSVKSIFYVAGYTAKKIGTIAKKENTENPFLICSRGLGKDWLFQNAEIVKKRGYIPYYVKDKEIKTTIPRTYLNWINKYNLWSKEELEEYIENKREYTKQEQLKKMREIIGEYHYKQTGKIWSKYDTILTRKKVKDTFLIDEKYNTTDEYINIFHHTTAKLITGEKVGIYKFYNTKWNDYKIKRNQMLKRIAEKKESERYQRRISKYVKYE